MIHRSPAGVAIAIVGATSLAMLAGCRARPELEVERVLDEYAAAYAARDMRRLEAVWAVPESRRKLVQRMLAGADRVSIELVMGAREFGVNSARVEFEQAIDYDGPAGSGYDRSRLRASLVRGADGRWTIVELDPLAGDGEKWGLPTVPAPIPLTSREPDSVPPALERPSEEPESSERGSPTATPGPPLLTNASALEAATRTLAEYRQAFTSRDPERLGAVWRMSTVERLLVERAWQGCDQVGLEVEIDPHSVRLLPNETGVSVDFDQKVLLDCADRSAENQSRVRAVLERGAHARWEIVRMTPRETGMPEVGALETAAAPPPGSRVPPLSVLDEYAAALQACDLGALARVWIQTPLERQYVEEICSQFEELSVAISGQEMSRTGDRARIDFTQDIDLLGAAGARRTRSDLTALMVRRSDGEWTIWKIREAN